MFLWHCVFTLQVYKLPVTKRINISLFVSSLCSHLLASLAYYVAHKREYNNENGIVKVCLQFHSGILVDFLYDFVYYFVQLPSYSYSDILLIKIAPFILRTLQQESFQKFSFCYYFKYCSVLVIVFYLFIYFLVVENRVFCNISAKRALCTLIYTL